MVGKPTEGKPRGERVIVRVLEEELAGWHEAAHRDGRTLSGWIRKLANDAAHAAGTMKPRKPARKR